MDDYDIADNYLKKFENYDPKSWKIDERYFSSEGYLITRLRLTRKVCEVKFMVENDMKNWNLCLPKRSNGGECWRNEVCEGAICSNPKSVLMIPTESLSVHQKTYNINQPRYDEMLLGEKCKLEIGYSSFAMNCLARSPSSKLISVDGMCSGEKCASEIDCDKDLFCASEFDFGARSFTCIKKNGIKSWCGRDEHCKEGLFCANVVDFGSDSNTCRLKVGSDVWCGRDEHCQEGLFCANVFDYGSDSNLCRTEVGSGVWCGRDEHCKSLSCVNSLCN